MADLRVVGVGCINIILGEKKGEDFKSKASTVL